MTWPGGLLERISAETQTFVSTTTRSPRLPDLANRLHHVALDLCRLEFPLARDPTPAGQERVEAPLQLVGRERAYSLRLQPEVDGFADQLGYGLVAQSAKATERLELLVEEVDVRASHRGPSRYCRRVCHSQELTDHAPGP
jgi:hypothetical protein